MWYSKLLIDWLGQREKANDIFLFNSAYNQSIIVLKNISQNITKKKKKKKKKKYII